MWNLCCYKAYYLITQPSKAKYEFFLLNTNISLQLPTLPSTLFHFSWQGTSGAVIVYMNPILFRATCRRSNPYNKWGIDLSTKLPTQLETVLHIAGQYDKKWLCESNPKFICSLSMTRNGSVKATLNLCAPF